MKKQHFTIEYTFSLNILNHFLKYAFCTNSLITINNLKKMQEVIINSDFSQYEQDPELYVRLIFLKEVLKLRVKRINNANTILEACVSGKYSDDYEAILNDIDDMWDGEELSDNEILMIDSLVSDILKYSFIFNKAAIFRELSTEIESAEFDSLHDICERFESEVNKIYGRFKKVKELSEDASTDFNSNDTSCFNAVSNTISLLNSPTNKVKTCIKMKNDMLCGGYEAGRFYLVLGLQGRGKSRELLQIAMDTKMVNPEFEIVDGKKGVILFITQENSIRETIERIWAFYYPNDDIKKLTNDEAYKRLCDAGFNKGPQLEVKFRKSRSITTQDVDTMIDEIEQDGKHKVVILIQDYLKRIRSAVRTNNMDTYTELGEITDEFCSIAKCRNIPVISAMQFNRNAMSKIEEAMKKSKMDPLKTISSSDIGESIKIVDNSDVIYSICDIYDPVSGAPMQSYNLLKRRNGKKSANNDVTYFIHPFDENNGIKLRADLNLATSLSKTNSGDNLSENMNVSKLRDKNNGGRPTRVTKTSGRAKSKTEALKEMIEGE